MKINAWMFVGEYSSFGIMCINYETDGPVSFEIYVIMRTKVVLLSSKRYIYTTQPMIFKDLKLSDYSN